jgi:hypothetical protein
MGAAGAMTRRWARKGNTTARGYGRVHQVVRARLAPYVAMGTTPCARCGELIAPGQPWDLGHDDGDRRRYTGPEHRRCNRATRSRRRAIDPPGRSATRW